MVELPTTLVDITVDNSPTTSTVSHKKSMQKEKGLGLNHNGNFSD